MSVPSAKVRSTSGVRVRLMAWVAVGWWLLSGPAQAAPFDETVTFRQPDGTEIRLHGKGDEFYAEFTDLDGYTVVFDPATKTYYYAQRSPDGNDLVSTGWEVGKVKPETRGLEKGIKINPASRAAKARRRYAELEAIVRQEERWQAVKEASRNYHELKKRVREMERAGKKGFAIPLGTVFPDSEIPAPPAPSSASEGSGKGTSEPPIVMAPPSFTLAGDVVGLTILVDFSDVPGTVVTQAQVDDYCNKPNYAGFSNAGSIFDYFFIQSGGKLRYNNNVTYYVRVPYPKSYYNDTSVDCGTCGRLLLNDALDVLIADGYDFSKCSTKVVGSKNYIRACNVLFAGANSGVWSYGLWPHRSAIPAKLVGPNMYVYDYQITEIGTTASLKIGTVCHENGHMLLGYPDLYSYDGNAAEIGNFSLMASGNYGGSPAGTHPVNIDPYLKKASGWMDVIELTSNSNQRCTVQVDGNQLYRYLNPAKATEYFVFEVRDNTGYEGPYGGQAGSVNPSAGLVVYHVYETGSNPYSSIWTSKNPTNSYSKPYELLLVEANQKTTINPWYDDPSPDSSDAFKSSGKSVISDTTTPELKFWVASAATNGGGRMTASSCVITNISADSSNMTFVVGAGPLGGTPSIMLSRNTINSYCGYGTNAVSQTFTICNAQGGTLNYTITDDQSWLSCSPASGTATTESDLIVVNFATIGLAAGSYSATITVTDPAASPTSDTIAVSLTVTPQPAIALAPAAISETGISGQPGPRTSFTINNTGGGSMNYAVSKMQSWLSLSPTSGTVVAETDTIYVDLDATSLAAGTYYDTITVSSAQAGNSPQTIPVTFNVQSADMIVTAPNGGERWARGETKAITWISSLGGNVQVELLRGGAQDSTLAASTPNDGAFDWVIPAAQAAATNYAVRITSVESPTKSDTSDANFSIVLSLADALDTTGLTWTNSGNLPWFAQTTTTKDGVDAAQSGAIGDNQSSSVGAALVGPGTMTFWWKVSSESSYDWLSFYLNDVLQTGTLARISGNVDWTQKTVSIPAGTNTVRWTYSKDSSLSSGSDAGWLDMVAYSGIGPGSLTVSPSSNLTSSGNYGGPFSPSSIQYVLSNPGGTAIDWTAGKSAAWVSLSSASGTLAASASATVTVSLAANANALDVGVYTDTVTFTNTTNGSGDTMRGVTLTVNPFPATVTLGNLNQTYDGAPKSVSVTTTPTGLAHTVTYDGVTNLPVVAGAYTAVATITQPNYSGSATGSLVIAKASQTISFDALDPVLDNAPPFTLTATASSGLPVSYLSSNTAVATVTGAEVTVVGVGSTVITASQAGNQNYLPAPDVQRTLVVGRANPLAVAGGPYKILFGQSLPLDAAASEPSYGQTITAYDWDLNNDGTFGDVTGVSNSVSYATLTGTWGLTEGFNTIKLRVTDSSAKTATNSATVEIIVGLTWDANGAMAGRTDGPGAWLDTDQWWDGSANVSWVSGCSASFGNGGAGGAVTLASPTTVKMLVFNSFSGAYTLGTAGQTLTLSAGIVKNSGSGAATIVSPVTLGGPQTWRNASSGVLSATGAVDLNGHSLTIDGAGTVSFSGTANLITGSGAATVSNGTLLVNGTLGTNTVTVAGGTLGGTGTLNGAVSVQAGGTLAPGEGIGTLTVSQGVTLAGTLAVELDDAAPSACDRLAVAGALNLAGATLNLSVAGSPAQSNYVIATYGSLSGRFAATNGLPAGYELDYAFGGQAIAIRLPASAAPAVTNAGGATDLGIGTATLNGMLTAGGSALVYVCWGEADGGTSSTGGWERVQSVPGASQDVPFAIPLTGLLYGVEYQYRVYATNAAGQAWSAPSAFVTLPPPAIGVFNTTAADVQPTSATLRGLLEGTGAVFTVTAHWSTNDNAGAAAWLADSSAGSAEIGVYTNAAAQTLGKSVGSLASGATYYYTLRASNAVTNLWAGPNASFQTPPPKPRGGVTLFQFR